MTDIVGNNPLLYEKYNCLKIIRKLSILIVYLRGICMRNLIADLVHDLKGDEQKEIWQKSTAFFEQFGFHITNYGMIDKAQGEILGFHSNMADDWMAHYMASKYCQHDPWAQHVALNEEVLLYSKEGPSELAIEKGSVAEKMMHEVEEHELDNSLCIPIHNKLGHVITGFNLCSNLNHIDFMNMIDDKMDDILLGAALINNELLDTDPLACKLSSWHVNPCYKQLLSEREIEVLKWLSEGNRNDRIADKMNIASVTVNYHLKEIKRKLGAKTREQSVAIAYKKGLLS